MDLSFTGKKNIEKTLASLKKAYQFQILLSSKKFIQTIN